MQRTWIFYAVMAIVGTGCALDHASDPCVVGVRPGGVELEVIPIPNFNIPARFELARDGSFVGHPSGGGGRCEGWLTEEEASALAAGIVETRLPCAASQCSDCMGVTDEPSQDVRIRVYAETGDLLRCNVLRVLRAQCATPLDAFLDDLDWGPLARVRAEGGCSGEPYEYSGASGGARCPEGSPLPTCDTP